MINVKTIVQSMRVPFLVLTPVCVFLGMSTVVANQADVSLLVLMLALLGAFLAHVSVNTLNEYFDFKSGLDLETIKTPFSGGSGALPQNPEMVGTVLAVGVLSSVALLMIGSFFVWQFGTGIVPIGITGLVIIATYTGWINKHPFICLLAPGLGFGFLMVAGTQFVLQGQYTVLSWLVIYNVSMGAISIIAGLLIWKEHSYALRLSGLISVAHITVLSLLLIIFNLVVAPSSIKAMIFRSVIWVIIFIVVQRTSFTKPAK